MAEKIPKQLNTSKAQRNMKTIPMSIIIKLFKTNNTQNSQRVVGTLHIEERR